MIENSIFVGLVRRARRRTRRTADDGSALVLTLVFVLVVSLFVLPVMNYVMAVTRSNRLLETRAERVEAVKGGLRVALVDPTKLYAACVKSGRNNAIQLAAPPGLGVTSECVTTRDALAEVPSDLRYALTTTQAGSGTVIPAPYNNPDASRPELNGTMSPTWCTSMNDNPQTPCGKPYPNNGAAVTTAWLSDATATTTGNKIWLPPLPPFTNTNRPSTPKNLRTGEVPLCHVFFPGRYLTDVNITDSVPTYFVSGVYYFEGTLRISGDANVVVGAGLAQGCADSDAQAVAETEEAPLDAYSNGVGGTFVFGSLGRFVVDTSTAGGANGASIVFNRRLVGGNDPLAPLNNISIMSVNGTNPTSATQADTDIPGQLHVPAGTVLSGTTTVDAVAQKYKASQLISPATPPAQCAYAPPPATVATTCPIIDFSFTTAAKVKVVIPGYVSVPQGSVSIQTASGAQVGKAISFGGGILAAQMAVNSPTPASLQLGLLNPVVQHTFKITTTTTQGNPVVQAIALVQINETGGYAVNSWMIDQA